MVELFADVPQETRDLAAFIWLTATKQPGPVEMANFLHGAVEIAANSLSEEELEYVKFHIDVEMEKLKNG